MAERYQVRGRRIWDSETDTYSLLLTSTEEANYFMKFARADRSNWTFVDARALLKKHGA